MLARQSSAWQNAANMTSASGNHQIDSAKTSRGISQRRNILCKKQYFMLHQIFLRLIGRQNDLRNVPNHHQDHVEDPVWARKVSHRGVHRRAPGHKGP